MKCMRKTRHTANFKQPPHRRQFKFFYTKCGRACMHNQSSYKSLHPHTSSQIHTHARFHSHTHILKDAYTLIHTHIICIQQNCIFYRHTPMHDAYKHSSCTHSLAHTSQTQTHTIKPYTPTFGSKQQNIFMGLSDEFLGTAGTSTKRAPVSNVPQNKKVTYYQLALSVCGTFCQPNIPIKNGENSYTASKNSI